MKIVIAVVLLSVFIVFFRLKSDNALLYQQSLLIRLDNVKTDTIYILKCFDIQLPPKVGKYTIVDISENTNSFLANNSSLYAVKLMPIELNKGTIQITFIDYVLKSDAGEIIMSNAGSEVFSYKYESQTKKYRLLKRSKNTI